MEKIINDYKDYLNNFESVLSKYFITKAPPLSKDTKTFFSDNSQWISTFLIILISVSLLSSIFNTNILTSTAFYTLNLGINVLSIFLGVILLIPAAIFCLLSFSGLKIKSKINGWNYLFYASILYFLQGIINNGISLRGLLTVLIFNALLIYIVMQIKEFYK